MAAAGQKAAVLDHKRAADGVARRPGPWSCGSSPGKAAVQRRLFVLVLRQVADQLDDGAAKLCRADFHEAGDQR
jgi:hypothetical protein